jgi:restriction endonuclease
LEEGRQILQKIEKEGPLKICVNSQLSNEFNAYWDSRNRSIQLNLFSGISEGELIGSLLFEMHNAAANEKLRQINRDALSGRIDKLGYIEQIERIEYQNALSTQTLIRKGVQQQLFPQDTIWKVLPSFQEHFNEQQGVGHTLWIGRIYDKLTDSIDN